MSLDKPRGGMTAVSTGGSGISFARKQETNTVQNLNAKKINIDFGSDDFFNSFQPVQELEDTSNPFKMTKTSMGSSSTATTDSKQNKLKGLDSDPFGLGSTSGTGGAMSINMGSAEDDEKMMTEKDAAARLKELGNRKAISSEDFINYGKEDQQIADRFSALKTTGAT